MTDRSVGKPMVCWIAMSRLGHERATSLACDVVDAVDVSYATLDVWASRVRCRMRGDCVVTRKCDSLSSHRAWRLWETTHDGEPLAEL